MIAQPRRSRRTVIFVASLMVLVLMVGAGWAVARATNTGITAVPAASVTNASAGNSAPAGSNAPAGALTPNNFANAIQQVAQKVEPAVVQITNEQAQTFGFGQSGTTVPSGVGSGVIYNSQGDIITNNHVIAGAQKLLVTLPDGRSFQGTVVGADPETDLAVLKINGANLPVAPLGNSRQLQVGDWVVAIGNALDLPGGPTVTAGVVSALGRTVQEPGSSTSSTAGPFLFNAIQTDAPINPGNSGGPLVNLAGQVVGIDTLVAGQAEPGVQAQGIGFAISINTAKPIADQLVATGHVVHPYLGIQYAPLTPSLATQYGISASYGMIVGAVQSGSPAAQAGLQRLDVITALNGTALKSESSLAEVINQYKPGDTVTLTVLRNNQTVTIKVTLGTMPNSGS